MSNRLETKASNYIWNGIKIMVKTTIKEHTNILETCRVNPFEKKEYWNRFLIYTVFFFFLKRLKKISTRKIDTRAFRMSPRVCSVCPVWLGRYGWKKINCPSESVLDPKNSVQSNRKLLTNSTTPLMVTVMINNHLVYHARVRDGVQINY